MLATWGCSTFPKPTLDLDFAGATSLDSRITFSRASTATFFNSLGVLSTAASGAARFDYNPTTLAPQGLLIEEQRTNSIRNNTMQGAVAGTPGTLPTNWSVGGLGTLTQQIVGTGSANGITYIDIRFSGTASTTQVLVRFDSTGAIAAANGQAWAISAWLAIVGGSSANTNTYVIGNNLFDSGNVYIGEGPSLTLSTPPTSTFTRYAGAGTIAVANTASMRPYFYFLTSVGAAIDITLRIGLPQLELGAFATSVIPTTTTALTRNADAASMTGTNFSSWYSASEGTFYGEANTFGTTSVGRAFVGNQTNYFLYRHSAGAGAVFDGTNLLLGSVLTAFPAFSKLSMAYNSTTQAISVNGAAVTSGTSNGFTGSNTLTIGGPAGIASVANGTIRRIAYYPTRLPDAQLQALTQ